MKFQKFVLVIALLVAAFSRPAVAQESPVQNEDVIFITGLVKNALNKSVIEFQNFDFGSIESSVIHATVNKTGHYAIALAKEYLDNPTDLVIQIDGYRDYVIKNIAELYDYVNQDLLLIPEATVAESKKTVPMSDSTVNPFILKF